MIVTSTMSNVQCCSYINVDCNAVNIINNMIVQCHSYVNADCNVVNNNNTDVYNVQCHSHIKAICNAVNAKTDINNAVVTAKLSLPSMILTFIMSNAIATSMPLPLALTGLQHWTLLTTISIVNGVGHSLQLTALSDKGHQYH